jgi:catechol 2,3-dioxygenase-like lactoylglutathione lyase family enzyme
MAVLTQVAPIFSVTDVEASLAFYASLGFRVRTWSGGGYGFAARDGIELHLGDGERGRGFGSAYVDVDDAAALAAEWRTVGATVHGPEDTPWGMHEGALVDPDGNVIRFGNPL